MIFLRPPGVSKTHLAIAAAESGRRAHDGTLVGLIEALEALAGRGTGEPRTDLRLQARGPR